MVADRQAAGDETFDDILDRIEAEIAEINDTGARAMEGGDYGAASAAIERGKQFIAVREWMTALRQEWPPEAETQEESPGTTEEQRQRRNLGRLPTGKSTPRQAYFHPILQVLTEFGGRARTYEVLDRVGGVMETALREQDRELLPAEPIMPRWRKNAAWAGYAMVRKGLLRGDSARGIWEISEAGKQALREQPPTV